MAEPERAEPLAYYLDGEGDIWIGNKDGTVSIMTRVNDGDRYAKRGLDEIRRMTMSMTKVGTADV